MANQTTANRARSELNNLLLRVKPDKPKTGLFYIAEISNISDILTMSDDIGLGRDVAVIRYSTIDPERKIKTKESFGYRFGKALKELLELAGVQQ